MRSMCSEENVYRQVEQNRSETSQRSRLDRGLQVLVKTSFQEREQKIEYVGLTYVLTRTF